MANGATGIIPRALVVLSAFADPFRQTTEVSVGCKLTYLDGVTPVPIWKMVMLLMLGLVNLNVKTA